MDNVTPTTILSNTSGAIQTWDVTLSVWIGNECLTPLSVVMTLLDNPIATKDQFTQFDVLHTINFIQLTFTLNNVCLI